MTRVSEKRSVVFVCVHNSARSQMAEAFLDSLAGNKFKVESAGLEPGVLNPIVVTIMKEVLIDISYKKPKSVFGLCKEGKNYDYVITVCDEVNAGRCPVFPGTREVEHWIFDDPSKLKGTFKEKASKLRIIRDQIKNRIELWLREKDPPVAR